MYRYTNAHTTLTFIDWFTGSNNSIWFRRALLI